VKPRDDDKLLRDGLRTNPLSEEALQRIRAATEAEWRATVAAKPARWKPFALVASLVGVAVFAGLSLYGSFDRDRGGEAVASLVRAEAPGLAESFLFRSNAAVPNGQTLRTERTYRAQGQVLLALADGGNLRLAAGAELEMVRPDAVRVLHGEVYVDIPPGSREAASFVVLTPAGEFRHMGTQFALAVSNGETRLRVREGEVLWRAADGESAVKAGNEVHVARDGRATRRSIAPSDTSWNWTAASAPDFDVEDRPLREFLAWVARESGREIVFADDATRTQVDTIRMHGNVKGLQPMQALSAVMAATPLRYELPEGRIRVSFQGESSTPR
jgi:ferric-dicitrate binding protein FerR (iron transport regulator)